MVGSGPQGEVEAGQRPRRLLHQLPAQAPGAQPDAAAGLAHGRGQAEAEAGGADGEPEHARVPVHGAHAGDGDVEGLDEAELLCPVAWTDIQVGGVRLGGLGSVRG